MGPCPLPGGKVDVHQQPQRLQAAQAATRTRCNCSSWTTTARTSRCIGHLNLGMALHPVVLTDGRIMFSSLESQGLRSVDPVGLWSIHPGRHQLGAAGQRVRARRQPERRATSRRNCPTARIVAEEYYNQNNSGFGSFVKFPPAPPDGYAAVRPGYTRRPAQPAAAARPARRRHAAHSPPAVQPVRHRSRSRRFARSDEGPADSVACPARRELAARRQGHASLAAPGQSPAHGLVARAGESAATPSSCPRVDGGIYLIKDGKPIDEPGADAAHQERPEVQRAVAARRGAVQAHLRRRRAEDSSPLCQRRQAVAAPAGGHAVRPGRHVEPVQARELSRTAS